jgi:hypothetical protein
VAVGWSTLAGSSETDLYIIRTDSGGDTLWTKCIGGPGSEDGFGVEPTADGGFIIAGHTSSYGAGGTDVYLVKTDQMGNVQWMRTFGGPQWDFGESIQPTADGGYIIGGFTSSLGSGTPTYSNAYLVKTDGDGNVGVAGLQPSLDAAPMKRPAGLQVWPNPFRLGTTVRYVLPSRSPVWLAVYDATGRLVKMLVDSIRNAGISSAGWNGSDASGRGVPSGVYFIRLTGNGFSKTTRVTMIR